MTSQCDVATAWADFCGTIIKRLETLPRPRKDSSIYFSSRNANDDMLYCRKGLHDFRRAYFYVKSADWKQNKPFPLASTAPSDLAEIPTYYVMDLAETMATTVASNMPSPVDIAHEQWHSESELEVYTQEFKRTGFQEG
jgi:hypothetical protein